MPLRVASFKIQGMNRDLSESIFKAEFAYENMNMRITATDNNTTLSLSNEKGNRCAANPLTHVDYTLYGTPIGYAVIDNILIIFTHSSREIDIAENTVDRIYKFLLEDGEIRYPINSSNRRYECMWAGNLGFSTKYPIETIVSYEAEKIKKVYWVDGLNQMRFINVADDIRYFKASDFDFTPEIEGNETVTIQRIESSLGVFPSGCVQYFFTYYNKYGQESGIFYSSTLLYTSPSDRGGAADQSSTCYFNIQLGGLDTNFDYVRVYAIHRTSYNTEVAAYLVGDYQITGDGVVLNDYGTSLSSIDSTELLFKSDEPIIAGTITQKDQRLFAGNISLDTSYHLTDEQIETVRGLFEVSEIYKKDIPYVEAEGVYPYENNLKLGESEIKSFKGGDWYRVAVQLQSKIGTWTEPIFLQDYQIQNYPYIDKDSATVCVPRITVTLKDSSKIPDGFTKMRALIANPLDGYKSIMCQGVLCPTMYHVGNRYNNSPYAVSSWFMRPIAKDTIYEEDGETIKELGNEDTALHFKHFDYVASNLHTNGEIQLSEIEDYPVIESLANYKFKLSFRRENMTYKLKIDLIYPGKDDVRLVTINTKNYNKARKQLSQYIDERLIPDIIDWKSDTYVFFADPSAEYIDSLIIDDYKTTYYIDQNIVTFHSPDINDNTQNKFDGSSLKMRIVGVVPITAGYMSYDVQTTGSLWNPSRKGLLNINYDKNNLSDEFYGLISAPLWNDDSKVIQEQEGDNAQQNRDQGYNFVVYPWHRNGSLNDDSNSSTSLDEKDDESIAQTSVLDKKIFANLRFSYRPFYFNKDNFWSKEINVFNIFNSDEVTAVPININNERKIYFGNVDTILTPNTEYDDTEDGTDYKNIYEVDSDTRSGYLITYNPGLLVGSSEGITYSPLISKNNFVVGKEPVSIKYKSTTHGIFRFENDYILPSIKIDGRLYNEKIEVDGFAIGSLAASQYAGIIRYTTTTLADYNSNYAYNENWSDYVGLIIAIVVPYNDKEVYCLKRIVRDLNKDNYQYQLVEDYGKESDIFYREYYVVTGYNDDGTEIRETRKEFYKATEKVENVVDANGDILSGFVLEKTTVPQSEIEQDSIGDISLGLDNNSGFLYIAELYRDDDGGINKVIYGETTEEALRNNTWVVNSDAVPIVKDNSILMIGDTFFGRWDCMKTYPFTNEDQNQVVDITSFMVESSINLDGRTDRNRGQKDNTVMSPTNFNLFNEVYNQPNNYFTYNITDNSITQYDFPNTIIWSLTKTNGEVIDTWAAMLMTSYLDMDGDKGRVTSLNKFDNNIICFQENAVSQILYNETTQITSAEGVPIEIANSGAVSGKRYLSDSVGAYNKWAVTEAPSGIYFIDDFARTLNILGYNNNAVSIQNLSDTAGFHSWFFNQLDTPTIWNPEDFGGIVTYYDAMNQDLMIITKDSCLSFSERVGGFGSFYSYENTPYFINIRNKLLTLHGSDNNYLIYFQNEGNYNSFFGEIKPYYTTVIVNSDGNESTFKTDKIFNNLEFRSDSWDEDGNLLNWKTFDTLKVWNEYQEAEVPLYDRRGYPSTLKKKFRIWRTLIPRDQKTIGKRNRIRNPWTYLMLKKDNPEYERTVLHDLTVYYFD